MKEYKNEVKVYQQRHIYLVGAQFFGYRTDILTQGELLDFEVSK